MLADPTGRFSDLPFPGRGGAVNRAAGLLLAKVADVLEDPDDGPALTRIPVPSAADDLHDLLDRIDRGRPGGTEIVSRRRPRRRRSARGALLRPDPAGADARRTARALRPGPFTAAWHTTARITPAGSGYLMTCG